MPSLLSHDDGGIGVPSLAPKADNFSDTIEDAGSKDACTYLAAEGGEEAAIVCDEDVLLTDVCVPTASAGGG